VGGTARASIARGSRVIRTRAKQGFVRSGQEALKPLASADEVFHYLRDRRGFDGDGDMDAVALFTYALVEQDRIDWMNHFQSQHDATPSAAQVSEWFLGKPESYFLAKEKRAEEWYAGFARTYLRDEIEAAKQTAVQSVVGNLRRFWPNFWRGLTIVIAGNAIIILVIILMVAAIHSEFSFTSWVYGLLKGSN
jgi:hypothetical protein